MSNWTTFNLASGIPLFDRSLRRHKQSRPGPINLYDETSKQAVAGKAVYQGNLNGETTPGLLRIWLKSPWEDYIAVGKHSSCGGSALCYFKSGYFKKAHIKASLNPRTLSTLQKLSDFRHPNVAKIHDVYSFGDQLFIAMEHLEISLQDLHLGGILLEEWEIATVITEVRLLIFDDLRANRRKVLKASTYLLSKGIPCNSLSTSSVRLSKDGDVKIGTRDL